MQYTTLGRTGLKVSVAGLGCGGFSRLGLSGGKSEDEAAAIVREALDLGVNLLDTAAIYGTESVVGKALKGVRRDSVVICTKASKPPGDAAFSADKAVASLDESLRRLGVGYIDVYQLHAVTPAHYQHVRDVVAPALLREKERGKFRFLGVTETAPNDPDHQMLARAVKDDLWETMMVAFHMLHQGARDNVFPATQEKRIGTLLMFVVRRIFARPQQLAAELSARAKAGELPSTFVDNDDPLGFLVRPRGAQSLIEAAYRYVRHEPGVDVVLFGTGDAEHLRTNLQSILKPPLPEEDRAKLKSLFSRLSGIGLDAPSREAAKLERS